MLRRTSIYILAAFAAIGGMSASLAQEGTPAANGVAASCDEVEAREPGFFATLDATPAAEQDQTESQATPEADAIQDMALEGDIADEATTNEVATLYQRLIDCLNKGDFMRAYALYSDQYLQRHLSRESLEQLEATPATVDTATQSEFGGVLEARVMDEGRIGALVLVSNPQSGDTIFRVILARDGDQLRIDDELPVESTGPDQEAGGAEGTPSA